MRKLAWFWISQFLDLNVLEHLSVVSTEAVQLALPAIAVGDVTINDPSRFYWIRNVLNGFQEQLERAFVHL
uniref:Uncharacterized protein n=1 Tax=Rhodnius prolixus TaxID=13249 RepID=T1I7U4_RHOPR